MEWEKNRRKKKRRKARGKLEEDEKGGKKSQRGEKKKKRIRIKLGSGRCWGLYPLRAWLLYLNQLSSNNRLGTWLIDRKSRITEAVGCKSTAELPYDSLFL